jgi:hypothetical protein
MKLVRLLAVLFLSFCAYTQDELAVVTPNSTPAASLPDIVITSNGNNTITITINNIATTKALQAAAGDIAINKTEAQVNAAYLCELYQIALNKLKNEKIQHELIASPKNLPSPAPITELNIARELYNTQVALKRTAEENAKILQAAQEKAAQEAKAAWEKEHPGEVYNPIGEIIKP